MEREIGVDIFSICLDKLKFVLSEGVEQQKLRTKKDFRSQCSSQFYKELRETVLILEDNSEQMRNKNEDLEHLDFALGKFIQFIVDEGRFDRLKDRKVRPRNLGIESLYLEIDDCIGDLIGKDEDEGILFKFEFIQNRINPYISSKYFIIYLSIELSRSLTSLTKAPKTMALLVKLTKFATEFFPNDLAFSNTLEDLKSVEDGVKIINCMSKILAEREVSMNQILDKHGYESNLSAAMKILKSKNAVIFYQRHLSYAQLPYSFNFVKANLFAFLLSYLLQDKDLSKELCVNFLLQDIHNFLPFTKAPLSLKNVSECFEDEKPM